MYVRLYFPEEQQMTCFVNEGSFKVYTPYDALVLKKVTNRQSTPTKVLVYN